MCNKTRWILQFPANWYRQNWVSDVDEDDSKEGDKHRFEVEQKSFELTELSEIAAVSQYFVDTYQVATGALMYCIVS